MTKKKKTEKEKKQKLKPGYFNHKPILKAISDLKFSVGLQDSCIQTNQVAILYLEEQATKSKNKEKFIKKLCKKYKISLGTSDLEYFKTIQYESFILQTYNFVEPFFKELNSAYRFYNYFVTTWKTKEDDKALDPFNQLLENIPLEKKNKIKSYPEYYLLDYYRLIRNSIVHLQESEEQHKKTAKYFSDFLVDKLSHFAINYEINGPNTPDKINFDDFMLYTRSLKYFSNILNDICFPEIDTLVLVAKHDKELQKLLLQSRRLNPKGDLLKRTNALRSFFHKHFNHSHKDLRDEFCESYLAKEKNDSSK